MASVRSDRSMDRSVRKQYTPITEPVSPGIFLEVAAKIWLIVIMPSLWTRARRQRRHCMRIFEVLKTVFKDDDTGSPVPEYWSNICTKAFNNKLKKDKLSDLQKEYKPPRKHQGFLQRASVEQHGLQGAS